MVLNNSRFFLLDGQHCRFDNKAEWNMLSLFWGFLLILNLRKERCIFLVYKNVTCSKLTLPYFFKEQCNVVINRNKFSWNFFLTYIITLIVAKLFYWFIYNDVSVQLEKMKYLRLSKEYFLQKLFDDCKIAEWSAPLKEKWQVRMKKEPPFFSLSYLELNTHCKVCW